MAIHTKKHEDARLAFRNGEHAKCIKLAEENYEKTDDMHSYIVAQTAKHQLQQISWNELMSAVNYAESVAGSSSHWDSVRVRGY